MRTLEIHALNGEKAIDPTSARKLIEHCGYWRRNQELKGAKEAAKPWTATIQCRAGWASLFAP